MVEREQAFSEEKNNPRLGVTMESTPEAMYLALMDIRGVNKKKQLESYRKTGMPVVNGIFQLDEYINLAATARIRPDLARQDAKNFLAGIYTARKYTDLEKEELLDPSDKYKFYKKIYQLGLVSLDEELPIRGDDQTITVTYKEAWQQSIEDMTDPFHKAYHQSDFALETEKGAEQQSSIAGIAAGIVQMVDTIESPAESLHTRELRSMDKLSGMMKSLGHPEPGQAIIDYIRGLYDTGSIFDLDQFHIIETFPILDHNIADPSVKLGYIDTALSASQYQMKNSFAQLVHTLTKGYHVEPDDLISHDNNVRVIDARGNVVYQGLADSDAYFAALGLADTPFMEDHKEVIAAHHYPFYPYEAMVPEACELYLKHDELEKTKALWRNMRIDGVGWDGVYGELISYALKKGDYRLFEQLQEEHREKSKYKDTDLIIGISFYVSDALKAGKVGDIKLSSPVKEFYEEKHNSYTLEFIQNALKALPPDHQNYQCAQELLTKEIQKGQEGKLQRYQVASLLAVMFDLKTGEKKIS